jgi:outer membrane protein assembly factor BamB
VPPSTPVSNPPPSSDNQMDRANPRGTGVYPGAPMLQPGNVLWRTQVEIPPGQRPAYPRVYGRLGATPAIAANHVFIGGQDGMVALDPATGQVQWRFPTPGGYANSPAVAGDTLYFDSGDSTVYALGADPGTERWHFRGTPGAGAEFTNPTVVEGVVYVGSSEGYLLALRASTGQIIWRVAVNGKVIGTPAVADGRLYFSTIPNQPVGPQVSFFAAADMQTGALIWRISLPAPPASAPAVVNGVVYFAGISLGLYAVEAQSGRILWKAAPGLGDPAVAYDTVYVTSGEGLYAFDAQTGTERWHFQRDQGFLVSPSIAHDVVYCVAYLPNGVNTLYAVDALSGQLRAQFPIAADIGNGVALAHGVLYFKGEDGYLYALH